MKLMEKINSDTMGEFQNNNFSKILIDENSVERSNSKEREDYMVHSVEKKLIDNELQDSKSILMNHNSAEGSPVERKINFVAKSVRFPK